MQRHAVAFINSTKSYTYKLSNVPFYCGVNKKHYLNYKFGL